MLTEVQQKLVSELNDRAPFRFQQLPKNNTRFSSETACGLWSNREQTLYWCPERKPSHANTILFHELCHATMHVLNRPSGNYCPLFGTDLTYDREEVLAESVARELTRKFGLSTVETEDVSARYIESYGGGLLPEDHAWIAQQIPLAMNYIMENWLPKFTAERKQLAAA